MWDSYLEHLSENLQEMCSALASNEEELAAQLAESLDSFNNILTRLKSSDEDRLATFLILHCNKDYDLVYEERKTNSPLEWVEEVERLAQFFLNGLCLDEGGSGWGALLIVARFKELLCRKLEQESRDAGVKQVPASAFVYAMQ